MEGPIELDFFIQESRGKKPIYVHIDGRVVLDCKHVFHVDLGSCASFILCALGQNDTVWIGINHLFKARENNTDMAFQHVAEIYNALKVKNVREIQCLGVFGAGYREKSLAKDVAQRNVLTILEALSFYELTIEIFQTGFSQQISLLKSDARKSFIIRHHRFGTKEKNIIEVPLSRIFKSLT